MEVKTKLKGGWILDANSSTEQILDLEDMHIFRFINLFWITARICLHALVSETLCFNSCLFKDHPP